MFPELLGILPAIILNKVVLPAPFVPISQVIDHFLISRETLFTAFIPPKFLEMF